MNAENKLYRDLQKHLDEQTIGFPKTESGSDIRLLKHLFHPKEAEMAMLLTYKYEPIEKIEERGKKIGQSIEEIERVLDRTARRGMIGYREKDGVKQYRIIHYAYGMLEVALLNPTPEFLKAHKEYSEEGTFWKEFLSTKVPQMRTIPIEKSINIEHHIGSYDEIRNIIETTEDPIVTLECVCRKGAERRGAPCKQTTRKETELAFHDLAKHFIHSGHGREVSKEEALKIIRKNEEENLVLQPSNAQGPDFVCACCGCCCGILRLHKEIPKPVDIWATNFFAEVNTDLCTGCGTCVESCQTGAMKMDEKEGISVVDLMRCLGCGLCVSSCPEEAIVLQKKEKQVIPPQTGEELNEVIMSHKN